jgi:sulfur carrier protein ThiS adenylyltransferase
MEEKTVIRVLVNERPAEAPRGSKAGELRERFKPGADLLVLNGFPVGPEALLAEGDRLVLIRRGEKPPRDELEALMSARHTPGVHSRMKRARVGIAGLGGLGSVVAPALTRMGVGELILADFDVVEPSNLNRQQYRVEDIGLPKTEAMTRQLRSVNPYIRLETHRVVLDETNLPEIYAGVDALVECLDRAEAKAMLIGTAVENLPETYVVGASGVAGYGDSNGIRTIQLGDRVFMVGDLVSAAEPGRGLMAPRVGIAANHQANLVVSLLMRGADACRDPSSPEFPSC